MDHLPVSVDPESDNSQSNLSDVATETFGNTALKFIDEYTRQKKRHRELFENLFKKYENMEVSGLKIRLEDIPDINSLVTDTRIKHKGNSEAHGMTEWQAEMESESDSITDVLEMQDISTVCSNSDTLPRQYFLEQQMKRFGAFMQDELIACNNFQQSERKIEEKQPKERCKESKRKRLPFRKESFTTQLVKKKSKSANITEADEISVVSTAGFNSAQKKNKSASISKGHDTSDLSVGSINSVKKKSKSANITEVAETSDLSTVGFNSAQRTRKPASISKGHETSELSVARINLELNMGNENWNEEHPTGLEYDNEVVKETKSKEGSLIPYVVLENYRKNQKLNMGNENWNEEHPMGLEYDNEVVKETKSKEGSLIPYVVLENYRKNQKLNVDNSSCKEDVLGNQSLKKSRFKKGHVLFADHVTKSSSRKSVISNTGENFKCVNDVAKVSANALAKSWKSEGFKKHLWHGIVPVCSLSRSPQTSSRSTLGFAPVSAMSPVPRLLRPLSPQTC
ncbi:uncharacterized protein LOC118196646 isoform X2 [Stegodyphus dumicola]|uniref:uncharacterized protein LOC118196646 isoform X2 n=1 Tax=Stegodyphus dumicola TaxID=202533 RepID=UPI0015B09709|nr:uncharacterized protein LOC118196646 isoform X2 [Stegodyphus dumicola]